MSVEDFPDLEDLMEDYDGEEVDPDFEDDGEELDLPQSFSNTLEKYVKKFRYTFDTYVLMKSDDDTIAKAIKLMEKALQGGKPVTDKDLGLPDPETTHESILY